jgi:type II secretory pathway pseudopilin PulG
MASFLKDNVGSSLLELVIAVVLFALLASSAVGILLMTIDMNERSLVEQKMRNLETETRTALHIIAKRDMSEFVYNQSAIEFTDGEWELSGEGTSELIDDVTRLIEFTDIHRSSSTKEIVTEGSFESFLDTGSKRADITLTYSPQFGEDIVKSSSVLFAEY